MNNINEEVRLLLGELWTIEYKNRRVSYANHCRQSNNVNVHNPYELYSLWQHGTNIRYSLGVGKTFMWIIGKYEKLHLLATINKKSIMRYY